MLKFGDRIEMMVDGFLIETAENLVFRHNPPKNLGKAVEFTEKWEGAGSLAISAVDDGKTVRLYYRGYPTGAKDSDPYQVTCLAVSEDGVNFSRLAVNEFDYKGVRENNVVFGGENAHNFAPFLDANPECDPDRRFKAIGGTFHSGGIRVYCSPDGIHFKEMADGPVITSKEFAFDSMNTAFWDPHAELYRCYLRAYSSEDSVREIWSCTSKDFIHWTPIVPNEYDFKEPEHLYTNAAHPVPGAEHVLVSIPMRFMESRLKMPGYKPAGVSDAILMTSRDGVRWNRTVFDAWIKGGLCSHEWTQRCFIAAGGIITRGDSFIFYVEQNYMWPDGCICAYSVPKFRFMSLYADSRGGSFVTKPLLFAADDVYLNFSTSAYGHVRMRVLSEDGEEVFDSGEIFGNELSHRVHVEGMAGKCGKIQFDLKEADLYAVGSTMD